MNNLPFEYHFKQCEYSKPAISKILDLKPSKAHYSSILSFRRFIQNHSRTSIKDSIFENLKF